MGLGVARGRWWQSRSVTSREGCADLSTRAEQTGPARRGTDMKRLPIQAVADLLAEKWSARCGNRRPKDRVTPSAMAEATREAATTTQPQPPSGGVILQQRTIHCQPLQLPK